MSEDESENTDGNYYNITHNFNKSDFTTQLFSNPVVMSHQINAVRVFPPFPTLSCQN